MPTKSANKAQGKAERVREILTAPKYSAITYSVVSVEPCITEDTKAGKLSAP